MLKTHATLALAYCVICAWGDFRVAAFTFGVIAWSLMVSALWIASEENGNG